VSLANREMKSQANLTEKYGEFPPDFWEDLIGHKVHVDCKSWPKKYALEFWGHDYESRHTEGEIKDFKIPRGKTFPLFDIFFSETGTLYNKLDIEYVLKYSPDIPMKYHHLKATFIVNLARKAISTPTVVPSICAENTEESDVIDLSSDPTNMFPSTTKKRKNAAAEKGIFSFSFF
jgi:hypothetical protein